MPKIAVKSKRIEKAESYAILKKRQTRRLTKKQKGLSTKPKYTSNQAKAPRRLSTKDKKKANKTLWESTFGEISRREIDSSDSEDDQPKKDAEIKN